MTTFQKIGSVVFVALCSFTIGTMAFASSTSLTLIQGSGDTVQTNVYGDPNSAIQLTFVPPTAISSTTIALGRTDANGNFSSTKSSGWFGIPAGSTVFATINGVQSQTLLWPNYSSTINLNKTSVQLAPGQSTVVTGSTVLTIASNNAPSVFSTSIYSNQLTITGLAQGSGVLNVCGENVGCGTISVSVGTQTTTNTNTTQNYYLTFSQNIVVFNSGVLQYVTVSGGQNNSYYIAGNSNQNVATASISVNVITLTPGSVLSSTMISVCSSLYNSTCSTLYITNNNITTNNTGLTFSQNYATLAVGNSTSITIYGGNGNNYILASNSNPGVVSANINGSNNYISLYGNAVGSSTISICSTPSSVICGTMYVSVGQTYSTLSLYPSSVTLTPGAKQLNTVNGGNANTIIYSNSNPNIVTAKLESIGSLVLLSAGQSYGSSTIVVCPTNTLNAQCATLNVFVDTSGAYVPPYPISSAYSGMLVKSSRPAVYYIGANGKRYVFPNQKTFYTWYPDFSGVRTISDDALAQYPIGGNVTYRPGSRLIKITSDPVVYAVDARGTLRHIMNEQVAYSLYGYYWSSMVDDVPDPFFTNYVVGTRIYSSSDFNPGTTLINATSINLDKGLW